MVKMYIISLLLLLVSPSTATGWEQNVTCTNATCVPQEDMRVFVKLLQNEKCRNVNLPKIEADSVKIIVDKKGRIYGSGTGAYPYTLHINWCNYQIEAKSEIKLEAAQYVEPIWGFRFRPKATLGILTADLFREKALYETLDGGLLLDFFYIRWANVNAYIGVRSFGAGVGADLTNNFGIYLGYALEWGSWLSNPYVSIYFSF